MAKTVKEDCLFCKIANGEIPSKTIYEDETFRVILDLAPASRGHALILPKSHADNLFELPEETAEAAMRLARKLAARMKEALHADGFNLLQNNGEAAGQTIFHFHMHLIPRYKGEEQCISFVSGKATQEELEEIKQKILK